MLCNITEITSVIFQPLSMLLFLSEKNRAALLLKGTQHICWNEKKYNQKESLKTWGKSYHWEKKPNPKPEEKTETFLSCCYKDQLHCLFAYKKIFCCVNQILKIMRRAWIVYWNWNLNTKSNQFDLIFFFKFYNNSFRRELRNHWVQPMLEAASVRPGHSELCRGKPWI